MLSANSSASRSIKGSLGSSSKTTPSKEYYRRKGAKRQSRETAATSLSSGSSTIHSGGDNQSVISAITMDFFDEDTTVSSLNERSYQGYRNGPKLGSMPEHQTRTSDQDANEVESYLDQMKHNHSVSTNRFSSSSDNQDTKLCAIPRRRSSTSESLEYKIAEATLTMNEFSFSEGSSGNLGGPAAGDVGDQDDDDDDDDATELTYGCSMRSLQGTIDEDDPLQVGLHGDDEGDMDDYHQPPMPRQSAHQFDSNVSFLGSSTLFDDSFQVGLNDEEDIGAAFSPGKRNDSENTQKTSNISSYNQFRQMYENRRSISSMAAMRSATDSSMFDSFQLGLLEEEEVELPNYGERLGNYNADEIEEKRNGTVRGKPSVSPKPKSSGGSAASRPAIENQSLSLDDLF